MITTLIETANTNRRTVDGRPYMYAAASVDSKIGTIFCRLDYGTANPKSFGKHCRATFELNTKRISRANLEKLLSA